MGEIKVNLNERWHRRAKIQAAAYGTSLKQYAEESVMAAVVVDEAQGRQSAENQTGGTMQVIQFIKQLWLSVRSNPYFVAFEGGATGAALSFINDALSQGHLDFSKQGLQRLGVIAFAGGVSAVRLLYRPAPGAVPVKQ